MECQRRRRAPDTAGEHCCAAASRPLCGVLFLANLESVLRQHDGQLHKVVLVKLHRLFRTNPTRLRPDRQVTRTPLKYAHCLHFYRYVKKLSA